MVLAVLVGRLQVVHLLVQALHILLDCVLVLCQADLDVGLRACDEPGNAKSEEQSLVEGSVCRLTSFRHPHRRWRQMADRQARRQSIAAYGSRGFCCSFGS